MSKPQIVHDATGILSSQPGNGHLVAYGTTVPADAAIGYSPGCIFIQTDGSAGTVLYVNQGTAASADFNAADIAVADKTVLDTLSDLTATMAEINRAADVSTRVVNATAATLTVTEADHDGKLIVLDRAGGIAVTLPAASAGLDFEFLVKTTFTGAATIKSVAGADIMIGHAIMGNNSDNTVVNFQSIAADTSDTIDLLGTSNSTGGMAGQRVKIKGLAANLWYVEIIGDAAGTEATPFANTVA